MLDRQAQDVRIRDFNPRRRARQLRDKLEALGQCFRVGVGVLAVVIGNAKGAQRERERSVGTKGARMVISRRASRRPCMYVACSY